MLRPSYYVGFECITIHLVSVEFDYVLIEIDLKLKNIWIKKIYWWL